MLACWWALQRDAARERSEGKLSFSCFKDQGALMNSRFHQCAGLAGSPPSYLHLPQLSKMKCEKWANLQLKAVSSLETPACRRQWISRSRWGEMRSLNIDREGKKKEEKDMRQDSNVGSNMSVISEGRQKCLNCIFWPFTSLIETGELKSSSWSFQSATKTRELLRYSTSRNKRGCQCAEVCCAHRSLKENTLRSWKKQAEQRRWEEGQRRKQEDLCHLLIIISGVHTDAEILRTRHYLEVMPKLCYDVRSQSSRHSKPKSGWSSSSTCHVWTDGCRQKQNRLSCQLSADVWNKVTVKLNGK